MTKKKIEALAAEYAREMFLWEDPFDAPSVPDEPLLKEFAENQEAVEADLAGQIRRDLNCGRALDRVKFGKYGIVKSENMISEEDFHKILESVPAAESRLVPAENPEKRTYFPRKGDIFYTRSKLPVVDENGNSSFIYTFKPCAVLLLDDGEKKPWNDKVFRCAVVTPDYMGDAVEGQDTDLKNGWILHKWLSYPVSIYQLDCTKKAGTVKDIDDIAEIVEKYSVSNEEMTRCGREERRLRAMAEYVPVTADTGFKLFEMAENTSESVVSRVKNRLNKFIAGWVESLNIYTQPAGFAAADEDSSAMVVRKGGEVDSRSFTAHLTDPIFLRKDVIEKNLPEWSFDLNEAEIPEGMVFVLRDKKDNSIGFGSIYHASDHGVAQLIEYFPDKLEKDISGANDVVLEIYIPW